MYETRTGFSLLLRGVALRFRDRAYTADDLAAAARRARGAGRPGGRGTGAGEAAVLVPLQPCGCLRRREPRRQPLPTTAGSFPPSPMDVAKNKTYKQQVGGGDGGTGTRANGVGVGSSAGIGSPIVAMATV